jgi:hypothetical protein
MKLENIEKTYRAWLGETNNNAGQFHGLTKKEAWAWMQSTLGHCRTRAAVRAELNALIPEEAGVTI